MKPGDGLGVWSAMNESGRVVSDCRLLRDAKEDLAQHVLGGAELKQMGLFGE